ncbi:NAD-dependent epimerase/dehydratase family protein [Nitratireductor sp. GCM10026969]|uniref:NAD-dependent epimerase/dehydratase family protein n=1 Tax=Nitratireductor sp. GCM10026969 TaxID=3252645 RepID=UPI0036153905
MTAISGKARPIVISGGSGFIGCNLAQSYLAAGEDVVILDNLSRPGVDRNLAWLREAYGARVHPLVADIRDLRAIEPALADAKAVFHLAAQTAVTTSLRQPFEDFEVNARGTLNVLEAVRRGGRWVPVIFASTNKVYGALEDLEMVALEDRYVPAAEDVRRHGIGEERPLSFCTPYGCSKGVADQYVLDYAASYGIPTAVLRMSCIYGPRQFGTEDQGWVAHFLIRALSGAPISIFGDGKQVRDVLHVADAVAAYRALLERIPQVNGQTFNLGGGVENAVSLRMVLEEIRDITGRDPAVEWNDWRPGDQHYFVADTRRLQRQLGWKANTGWRDGLRQLAKWLREERGLGRTTQQERLTA